MSLPSPLFTVAFDREIAWCISYADEQGYMRFCFEPGVGKQVFLNPSPVVGDKVIYAPLVHAPRYSLAVERAKDFLAGCGYDVAISDESA